jgi:hypothetical protein
MRYLSCPWSYDCSDAFRLRGIGVTDDAQYAQSFLTIVNPRLKPFVNEQL